VLRLNFNKEDLNLYLVTDRSWIGDRTLVEDVEKALKNGVTFLQIREKELEDEAFLKEALKLKTLAAKYNVPYVINDNINVAIACDADGVHIGQKDMAAASARQVIGPDKILGVSVKTVEEAKYAESIGADYLGVGAVFSTTTKLDAADVDYETLKAICDSVSIPVVAIGGIHHDNIDQLAGSGIYGVAVVSAILAQNSIDEASADLSKKCRHLF